MAGYKQNILGILQKANGNLAHVFAAMDLLLPACLECALADDLIQDSLLRSYLQAIPQIGMANQKNPRLLAQLILLLAGLSCASKGLDKAVTVMTEAATLAEFQEADLGAVYAALKKAGWMQQISDAHMYGILQKNRISELQDQNWACHVPDRLMTLFGFGQETELTLITAFSNAVVLPWLDEAIGLGYYECALLLERRLYLEWVSRYEVMDHYQKCHDLIAPRMAAAGRAYGATLAPMPERPEHGKNRVGIIIYSASWLAHVDLLYQTVKNMPAHDYEIRLYFLNMYDEKVERRFSEIGIGCYFMERDAPPIQRVARLEKLRKKLGEDAVGVAIWLCLPLFMEFSFSMRLAPYQVYWSMKHPVSSFKTPDGYWASCNAQNDEKEFHGFSWQAIPVTYEPSAAPDGDTVSAVRATLPEGGVVLGTIAREEKLNSPDFLDAVSSILEQNENAVYLYTGKHNPEPITRFFEGRGVAGQVRYIGWVDPRLYASVFDVYIDCWPARSGMTAYAALEAARPIVANVAANENHDFVRLFYFYFELVREGNSYHLPIKELDLDYTLPDGSHGILACDGKDAYVGAVSRLIRDKDYRTACGNAGRMLCRYLNDSTHAGKRVDALLCQAFQKVHERMAA